jgi:hypothetical protein
MGILVQPDPETSQAQPEIFQRPSENIDTPDQDHRLDGPNMVSDRDPEDVGPQVASHRDHEAFGPDMISDRDPESCSNEPRLHSWIFKLMSPGVFILVEDYIQPLYSWDALQWQNLIFMNGTINIKIIKI